MSDKTLPSTERPAGLADHDERFDPEERIGELIGAEHLARYLWASQIADGKDVLDAGCGVGYGSRILAEAGGHVTGVDASDDAIAESIRRAGDLAEFRVADVTMLPFAPHSFDAVVCFEVIEHLGNREAALDELKRVLRPGGVAIVSSPNRGVYPAGNPHHVFEYTSGELLDALGERFEHGALFRQHPWLASRIEPANGGDTKELPRIPVGRTQPFEPGSEVYGLVLASDQDLPAIDELVVMGDAFEVRWFHDRIDWQNRADEELRRALREKAQALRQQAQVEDRLRATTAKLELAGRRLLAVEAENSRLAELEREIEARKEIANEIAAERDVLALRVERADQVHAAMTSSISWRLTAPLRIAARPFKRQ